MRRMYTSMYAIDQPFVYFIGSRRQTERNINIYRKERMARHVTNSYRQAGRLCAESKYVCQSAQRRRPVTIATPQHNKATILLYMYSLQQDSNNDTSRRGVPVGLSFLWKRTAPTLVQKRGGGRPRTGRILCNSGGRDITCNMTSPCFFYACVHDP